MTRTAYARCPDCRFHPVSSTCSGSIPILIAVVPPMELTCARHSHQLATDNRCMLK